MDKNFVCTMLQGLPHHTNVYNSEQWVTFPNLYPIYGQALLAVNPESIFEIGTLTGYVLSTAASLLPNLKRIEFFDNETGQPGSNRMAEGNIRAARAASGFSPFEIRHWKTEGKDVPSTPVDLVHVDGRHEYAYCFADLQYAFSLKPKYIMGHDITLEGMGVRQAVTDFLKDTGLGVTEIDLQWGAYIIALGGKTAQDELEVALQKAGVPLRPFVPTTEGR